MDSIEARAKSYTEEHTTEKVHIHFDKPFYLLGEDSWYKAYVVKGSDLRPTDISSVLYVEWIDPSGTIIKQQRLKIENGEAVGDVAIDSALTQGLYTVRAYTTWMRNSDPQLFFYQSIPIFDTHSKQTGPATGPLQPKIDLQFFPEGGTFVESIPTQIAFKAINVSGLGADVAGVIVDESNNQVTTFRSAHNGMGAFTFTAQPRESYRAVLPSGDTYQLPVASKEGLTLTASNRSDQKVVVRVQASKSFRDSPVYLIGQARGSVCYAAYLMMNNAIKDVVIPKTDLPEGVVRFTLFDGTGVARCERMVFIKKQTQMDVSVASDKEQFLSRDSISLKLKVTDGIGNPREASLSVSVTDADFTSGDRYSGNIYTSLLLQSDLKGKIENPRWYFESQGANKSYYLDLVMLTHGWSRYDWEEILNPSQDIISFKPEEGITLQGKITAKDVPVANAPFTLTVPQSENVFFNIYQSDSLGNFVIPDLDFTDTLMFSWRVMSGKKGKVQKTSIQVTSLRESPPIVSYFPRYDIERIRNDLLAKAIERFRQTSVWGLDKVTLLEEVVVTAQRNQVRAVGSQAIAVKPGPDDLKRSTAQFVSSHTFGLSGARLNTSPDGTMYWTVQHGGLITISIDGIMQDTGSGAPPFAILNGIDIADIDLVIIAKSNISIITKQTIARDDFGIIKIKLKGFDSARDFYHPKYGPHDVSSPSPDNRMTLYWNPKVQTDKQGNATIKFYNTDTTQTLNVVVEGIVDGHTISESKVLGKE